MTATSLKTPQIRQFWLCVLTLGAAICTGLPAVAATRDLPTFRPGLWQFDRTLEADGDSNGRRVTSGTKIQPRDQRCVDPTKAMRNLATTFPHASCRPPTFEGKDGEFVLIRNCGADGSIKTVIKVESDSAYTETTEGTIGALRSREAIAARRIGDCRSGSR
jgi:hypothetical protein